MILVPSHGPLMAIVYFSSDSSPTQQMDTVSSKMELQVKRITPNINNTSEKAGIFLTTYLLYEKLPAIAVAPINEYL